MHDIRFLVSCLSDHDSGLSKLNNIFTNAGPLARLICRSPGSSLTALFRFTLFSRATSTFGFPSSISQVLWPSFSDQFLVLQTSFLNFVLQTLFSKLQSSNLVLQTSIFEPRTSNLDLPTSLLRKEVIQPHLPIRLPCYDFTPIIDPTFDG